MLFKTTVAAAGALILTQPVLAEHPRPYSYHAPPPSYVRAPAYSARAGEGGGEVVYAQVLSAQPIVRHVTVETPRRECWDETVYRPAARGTAPATIAGGIIGGTVGSQFGSGRGQTAMTLLGTLVGSAIARDVAAQRQGQGAGEYADTVQRCEVHTETHEEQRIEGYDVTYLYNGREYRTRTRQDPGAEIAVRVSVTPVGP